MELNEKIASIPPHITEKHQRIAYLEAVLAKIVTAERVLHRNVQRFQGGLVFKAHRLCVSA